MEPIGLNNKATHWRKSVGELIPVDRKGDTEGNRWRVGVCVRERERE
jgi:hypothetical protein